MSKSARRSAVRYCAAMVCCALAGAALANPTGPTVVSGQASFQAGGSTLTITNSPGTIINWQGFSIAKDELTRFLQQSAVSAVLNRVVGGNPSEILGRLSSNGRVYLINPNGIAFGPDSRIDVGGLVASTLNMSDADFLSGRQRFSGGGEGRLLNQGNITTPAGGGVFMVGPQVENAGVIRAPSGDIVLAAGRTVQLVDAAFPSIRVEVSAPADRPLSLGNLSTAASGKVFAFLVRQSGVASASAAATGAGGKVVLQSAGETLLAAGSRTEATGALGGAVIVTGEQVRVASLASIDVSGAARGGAALIGGGYQGADPAIANARLVVVEPGATLKASATVSGDGGKVVVFADRTTHFAGAIEARGGPAGGDGGTVEVSGKASLTFAGAVDTRAPAGRDGTLLIDPARITITAAPTGLPANLADGAWLALEDLGTQLLGAANLASLLETTSVRLQASESITVAANVVAALSAARTLTLEAPTVRLEGTIASTGAPLKVEFVTRSLIAQPLQRNEQQVQQAAERSVAANSDLARLRAEIEAEIGRDRARLAQAINDSCSRPGAVKQGCTVNPPRRFAFAG